MKEKVKKHSKKIICAILGVIIFWQPTICDNSKCKEEKHYHVPENNYSTVNFSTNTSVFSISSSDTTTTITRQFYAL